MKVHIMFLSLYLFVHPDEPVVPSAMEVEHLAKYYF